jgi:chromate transporter
MTADSSRVRLLDIARVFLRLGGTSFGGPAVHVAMMQEEIVDRRAWMTREEFLDRLGAANLIPGPSSTEMAIHVGYARGGWPGLVVAGVSFILPAFLLVWALAAIYMRHRALPQVDAILYGVKPVVVVVVAQAVVTLARAALKTRRLVVIAAASLLLGVAGIDPLLLLVFAGVAATAVRVVSSTRRVSSIVPALATSLSVAAPTTIGLAPLFLVFLKIGALIFGSGYVLIAFLRAELVARRGWLTESQLIDAIAIGQVTPGPLFTTATFVGYVLRGTSGALVATLGIFLPAFAFVAVSGALVPRLRRAPAAGAFLDGVNVASLALIVLVTAQTARVSLVDMWTVGIALASALALFRFRIQSLWLVLAGAVIGCLKAIASPSL